MEDMGTEAEEEEEARDDAGVSRSTR